jgi:hypothetical protein
MDAQQGPAGDSSEELLRRALIDPDASVAVAMRVKGLALSDALTIVFHGRADLGTIQTYVAHGPRGAGSAIGADELLRVPCDLDLGDAETRGEAEEAYAEQARTLRDALLAADTVLSIWREPLQALAETPVDVDRSVELQVRLPAHRLMPVADDPAHCLEDFAEHAADHARRMAERLDHQEASVRRFLELSGEDFPEAG